MCCMVTISMLFMFLLGSGQSYELPGPGTLRSLKKNVTGSTQHPELTRFALSFAVDGSSSRDSSSCTCCASTQIQVDPWIQIDLGRLYRVETVEVIGRTDHNDSFKIAIFVSTTNTIWQSNKPTQPTLPDVPEQYHNITFSYPVIGQFVTLQLNGKALLCVCEVNIYSRDCSNSTYGLYCNETCGQCQDRKTCDFVTGRCTRCLPGYQLPMCTEVCMPGTFGPDCSSLCHCKDNTTCDHVNGSCPDNKCDVGWQGSNCSLDALISLNANVTASSKNPHSKFALSRAVDGSTSMNSTACKCCAATNKENKPWIQINLGRLYRVATVEVISRIDWQKDVAFAGMQIYLHEKRDNWTLNYALVRTIPEDGSRKYITTIDSPVIAQYVTLQTTENNVMLVVCEVSVYSSDCSPGTYGLNCNETCGQFCDGKICDHVTGICTQCLPGYQFPLCKKECLPGSFGTNCSSTCHCQHNLTCNHANGSCPEGICDLGWHGSNCSQVCPPGTYGLECNITCGQCQTNQTCNPVTGNCTQCTPGYQFPLCKETCESGFYGLFCNKTCGQCQGEEICDHVTGRCTQCRPGYQHPLCTDKCPPERFGQDCAAGCNCPNNQTCDHVTGECPDNICDVGWMGSNCSVECDNMTYGTNCAKDCGNCYKGSCDRRTGECSPCSDGYTGSRCIEECPTGTFSFNCFSICHCYDNVTCDHVTGSCPEYRCEQGWQGFNCSQECLPGTFGSNCYSICHCFDNVTCDHVTGSCINGTCDVGWQGYNCSEECPAGYFGFNCSSIYHCHDNITCDHATGSCPDDRCGIGWQGFNCSEECDHMTYGNNCAEECGNCFKESCDRRTGECSPCFDGYTGPRCTEGLIRLSAAAGIQVSMSSVHAGMDATKAIDGQLVDDPETCGCCSETTNEYTSWWQVDLGRPFFLKKVILYGRLNENVFRQLVGFSIVISLTDEFPDNPVHNQNGEIQDSKAVVLLPDVAARYVRIQRLGILTICEVEIVQSDIICPTYTYGRSCAACGPCKNGSCDRVTGVCLSGCYDGYEGNMCEKLRVHKSTDNDVINGVIGAGVGVITSLLVAALIVALFLYKKGRIRIYEEPTVRWAKEPTKESAYATLENQEIVIEKEESYDNPM